MRVGECRLRSEPSQGNPFKVFARAKIPASTRTATPRCSASFQGVRAGQDPSLSPSGRGRRRPRRRVRGARKSERVGPSPAALRAASSPRVAAGRGDMAATRPPGRQSRFQSLAFQHLERTPSQGSHHNRVGVAGLCPRPTGLMPKRAGPSAVAGWGWWVTGRGRGFGEAARSAGAAVRVGECRLRSEPSQGNPFKVFARAKIPASTRTATPRCSASFQGVRAGQDPSLSPSGRGRRRPRRRVRGARKSERVGPSPAALRAASSPRVAAGRGDMAATRPPGRQSRFQSLAFQHLERTTLPFPSPRWRRRALPAVTALFGFRPLLPFPSIALAKAGFARRRQSAGGFGNPLRVPIKTEERVGVEPTVPCGTHDFQSCPFGHSGISPI